MRLSDARMRQHQTKLLYPDHRLPPWLTEYATRDRSNRLLEFALRYPSPHRNATANFKFNRFSAERYYIA